MTPDQSDERVRAGGGSAPQPHNYTIHGSGGGYRGGRGGGRGGVRTDRFIS